MMEFVALIAGALLLDLAFGDPHSSFHPVALFGRAAMAVETFCRKSFGSGILSGLIGWLVLTFSAAVFAYGSVWFVSLYSRAGALVVAVFWIDVTIALRSLVGHACNIGRPLRNGELPAARRALSMIVSRDTGALDESEIVRGAVESLGENLVDAVTSPLFFAALGFAAGGIPGAAAGAVFLRAANTLDACWGYRSERYLRFGRIAARADDAAHWIPARLTLLAIGIAALISGGSAVGALRAGIRHRNDHPSPNSAWGMAGFAGALGIRLGGPTRYGNEVEEYPFWGSGRSRLECGDLHRAERLAVISALVFAAIVVGGVWIWRTSIFS